MDKKEWQEMMEQRKKEFPEKDRMSKSLIKLHGVEIEETLKRLGRKWIGKESPDMFLGSQKERRRFVIHHHIAQWRITLWFGTYLFPASIPNFFDADGEDFYEHDVKGQCATVMITIPPNKTPLFNLTIHDTFQNICGEQHEDIYFEAIDDLRERLNNTINSIS